MCSCGNDFNSSLYEVHLPTLPDQLSMVKAGEKEKAKKSTRQTKGSQVRVWSYNQYFLVGQIWRIIESMYFYESVTVAIRAVVAMDNLIILSSLIKHRHYQSFAACCQIRETGLKSLFLMIISILVYSGTITHSELPTVKISQLSLSMMIATNTSCLKTYS